MKLERFDHMHVSPKNFEDFNEKFQKFMGMNYLMNMPMPQYGTEVAYEPAPIGMEAFKATDPSKSLSAKAASEADGIFAVCYKVANLAEAIEEMEAKGWKQLEYYDNAPILEALFDTKDDFGFYIELTEYPFESMREMASAQ